MRLDIAKKHQGPESFPYKTIKDLEDFGYLLEPNLFESCRRKDLGIAESTKICVTPETRTWIPKKLLERQSIPKTLLCHDYKGGYLDDRFKNGCSNMNAYSFYNWSGVDIFVYFSHHLVTVPPPCWIKAAHEHGVVILGTVITEGVEGVEFWNDVLSSDERVDWFVTILSKLALFHQFDGYLLNVENTLTEAQVKKLVELVKKLKIMLSSEVCENYIIWYDAVTIEGKLEWQNELNDKNNIFFEVCDGIFLNYTWTIENLDKSVKKATERAVDVYVGIDVFGRNCRGGFDVDASLKDIRDRNFSCAIFAFGWTHEVLPGKFHINDLIFWQKIWPYFYIHGITKLPFKTNFCRGYGLHLYKNGKIIKGPWHDLSQQQYQISNILLFQPYKNTVDVISVLRNITSLQSKSKSETKSSIFEDMLTQEKSRLDWFYTQIKSCRKTKAQYVIKEAYNGGGCIRINPPDPCSEVSNRIYSLFICDIPISTGIILKIITKHLSNSPPCVPYVMMFTSGKYMKIQLDCTEVVEVGDEGIDVRRDQASWKMSSFLSDNDGRLLEIGLQVEPGESSFLLGELEVVPK